MSTDPANDHQGPQRARPGLHPQAGYQTAVITAKSELQELACHTGGVHMSDGHAWSVTAAIRRSSSWARKPTDVQAMGTQLHEPAAALGLGSRGQPSGGGKRLASTHCTGRKAAGARRAAPMARPVALEWRAPHHVLEPVGGSTGPSASESSSARLHGWTAGPPPMRSGHTPRGTGIAALRWGPAATTPTPPCASAMPAAPGSTTAGGRRQSCTRRPPRYECSAGAIDFLGCHHATASFILTG
jgi:hypothetical protein